MGGTTDKRALLALLGVDEKAPWEEVRRAFRDAVRASHPDLHTDDPGAEGRLKTLNAAWESVNTPGKWAQYVLPQASPAGPDGTRRRPAPATDPSLGRFRIMRQRAGSAGMRRWKLELDGNVVATIENGAVNLMDAQPGPHTLRVFYESYSSPELRIELRAGQELVLGCRQDPHALRSLFAPRRALILELLDRGRIT